VFLSQNFRLAELFGTGWRQTSGEWTVLEEKAHKTPFGTDNVREQISEHFFLAKYGGYCLNILPLLLTSSGNQTITKNVGVQREAVFLQ